MQLGFNCNCFTNRYDEPEAWTALCAELGVKAVMFNIDLIDPGWSWDVQRRLCDRTLEACAARGIALECSFGGHHGHRHYLGHPDEGVRRQAEEFYRRAIRQTAYLGGRSFGTCFAIMTVASHRDRAQRREILDDAVRTYHRLAEYGAEAGLEALAYEMTSVPRETCATFEENDLILGRCAGMALPMRICLDMGHRNMNGSPQERDHLAWIRRYGRVCDVIDAQQTDLTASRHWPFTEEYNRRGAIKGEEVVAAVKESGNEEILLALEIRVPAFHPQEEAFVSALRSSVAYWRRWILE
jgi:sugar phosphate isomerase/epimerase